MIIPFCWTVIKWSWRATATGYPTANIALTNSLLDDGTYKINAVVWSTTIPWMGVFFKERWQFEAHLFGFAWDLYGQQITIYPLCKIRDNMHFSWPEQLATQLNKDKETAMNQQIHVLTFGTFDHFHQGHHYYLSIARRYGDSLITIIARDKTVKRLKAITPTDNEQTRLQQVKASGTCTHVLLWSLTDHYACFEQREPDVICLGYDQHSFDTGIVKWFVERELEIPQIVRIDSFHPDTYKSTFYRE